MPLHGYFQYQTETMVFGALFKVGLLCLVVYNSVFPQAPTRHVDRTTLLISEGEGGGRMCVNVSVCLCAHAYGSGGGRGALSSFGSMRFIS